MTEPTPPLRGVLPVIATPYRDDWTIDADVLATQIDWLYTHGADGLVVAMVSEVLRLATDEREVLAELVVKANGSRGPVVIGVGADATAVAIRLARHAEAAGAAAVMAIPPRVGSLTGDALREYYDALLAAVTIPVIVQDASGYTGGDPLSAQWQADLLAAHGPDRVLFKPEATPVGPRLSALRDATAGAAAVFEGSGGGALVDSHRRGIVGTMPGPDVVWATSALWRALQEGDIGRARRISAALMPLLALQQSLDAYVTVQKYLLVKQGVLRDARARPPLGFTLDAETTHELDELFDGLAAVVHGPAG